MTWILLTSWHVVEVPNDDALVVGSSAVDPGALAANAASQSRIVVDTEIDCAASG